MNPQEQFDPQILKSFDLVIDLVKQLMAMSTGIIALTISFHKDVFRAPSSKSSDFLKASWLMYAASLLCSILALMAISGAFGRGLAKDGIYQGTITLWVGIQIITFLAATIFVIISGWLALNGREMGPVPAPPLPPAPPVPPVV